VGVLGVIFFVLGVLMAMSGGGHEEGGHASAAVADQLVASVQQHAEASAPAAEHHGSATWLKRIYASLWANNVFSSTDLAKDFSELFSNLPIALKRASIRIPFAIERADHGIGNRGLRVAR